MQQMETTVAKEGVHTQYSRSSAVQHCANNGNFSIFPAALHCYALCVDEGSMLKAHEAGNGGSLQVSSTLLTL